MAEPVITEDAELIVTSQERTSGDGQGTAQTVTFEPKPGTTGANTSNLIAKAEQALTINATFLSLTAPTNAEILTQVRRLTRENSAIIRLLIGRLDTTDGT